VLLFAHSLSCHFLLLPRFGADNITHIPPPSEPLENIFLLTIPPSQQKRNKEEKIYHVDNY